MSSPATIDAEMLEVLRDAARDPRSRLLRSELLPTARDATGEITPLTARSTGLRPAERELVRRYREATVDLLRRFFHRKLELDEDARAYVVCDAPSEIPSARTRADCERRLREIAETGLGWLVDAEGDEALGRVSFDQLGSAMVALHPSLNSRTYMGCARLLDRDLNGAREVFDYVVSRPARARIAANAWSQLGVIRSMEDQSSSASLAFALAAGCCPHDFDLTSSALVTALDARDLAAALLAGRLIEQGPQPSPDRLNRFVLAHRKRIQSGHYQRLDADWAYSAERYVAVLGPTTSRIVHAFLAR